MSVTSEPILKEKKKKENTMGEKLTPTPRKNDSLWKKNFAEVPPQT